MAAYGGNGGGVDGLGIAASRRGSAARRGSGSNSDVLVVRARSGSGSGDGSSSTDACGSGGDGSWTPSPIFREQPLKREETPFFSQMTARVCRGGPFPSYRAQDGSRGEMAHLRPTTLNLTKS